MAASMLADLFKKKKLDDVLNDLRNALGVWALDTLPGLDICDEEDVRSWTDWCICGSFADPLP